MAEILIDVDLRHPVDRVWRALTEQGVLSAWFMPNNLEPHEGRHCTLEPHGLAGFDGPIDVELVEVAAPRRMAMLWQDGETRCRVTWDVAATTEGARLSMAQSGFFGVHGTLRRRKLQRTYDLMLHTRLPAVLDRIAAGLPAEALLPAGLGQPTADPAARDLFAGAAATMPAQPGVGGPHAGDDPTGDPSLMAFGSWRPAPDPGDAYVTTVEPPVDRRRFVLWGALAGTAAVVVAVVLGGWLLMPRLLPILGGSQAAAQDSSVGAAGGGGGLGPAPEPTQSPLPTVEPTAAHPRPAASASTVVPAGGGQGTDTSPQPTPKPKPKPTHRPGGGTATQWFAGYHVVRQNANATTTEVVVGNIGKHAGNGWRVTVTLADGLQLGTVRNAVAYISGNQVTFTAVNPDAELPPNASIRFRFKTLGDGDLINCSVNGTACVPGAE